MMPVSNVFPYPFLPDTYDLAVGANAAIASSVEQTSPNSSFTFATVTLLINPGAKYVPSGPCRPKVAQVSSTNTG